MFSPSRFGRGVLRKAVTICGAASLCFLSACSSGKSVGPPAKLSFTVQPSNSGTGSTFNVSVSIEDANGNVVTSATSTVTIAVATNACTTTCNGTLSGTLTATAVNGVATFSGLSLSSGGTGYTITASATGLTGATSTTFTVFGTAAKLVFTAQPTNVAAGSSITPSVTVSVEDAQGNVVGSASNAVTIALGTNPTGATLSGTLTANAASGVATFSTLNINKVGTGYTLAASSGTLTSATSNAFNVTVGAAAKLVFTQQPSNVTAGASIAPAVTVTIEDSQGNTVTTATNSVTMAIGTNPSSGTLSGTTSAAAVAGVATFSNLSINAAGTGYALSASATGLTGATSSAFNVLVGAAAKLAFTTQPANTTAGASFSVVASVEDASGNVVPTANVAVSLAFGTNPSGATLSGTTTVTSVSGVATFSGLSIAKSGTGDTLVASSAGLTSATSNAFNVAAGAAAALVFTTQPPASITAGSAMSVAVTIEDSRGNTVTTATNSVTVAIGTNPSSGTLSGATSVAAVAGVATFSNLSINAAGTGYTLAASAAGLSGVASSAFTVTVGAAAKLAFTTQPPASVTAGSPFAVAVTIEDSEGNTVTSAANSVTLAIGTNPSSGTLSGTTSVTAAAGVATFAGLSINAAGSGYTLAASATGLTAATSSTFNITAGAAAKLVFGTQPGNTVQNASINSITVDVEDALGNVVTTATNPVSMGIGTNPGAGTLGGTTTVNAVAGVATFSNLTINNVANGYTLVASATGLTNATSGAFNIILSIGPASKLTFTQQPANVASGASITPAVLVAVQDSNGNTVTTATNSITIAIGTNPSSGTLSGTVTAAAVQGVATFSNLSINKAGTGYTLTATSGTLTAATSSAFNVTAGAASKLVFTQQPTNVAAGAAITPAVQVSVEDTNGNVVTTATNSITVAIGTNPSSGTLSGTLTVAASSGVASFSTLNINKAGTGYTLTAAATGLTGATSNTFNVTVGAASQLVFSAQPTNVTAGATITPAVQVSVEDASGNVVTTATNSITVAIGTNPSSGTLSGTLTAAASSGVASFSTLNINKAGTGYTLTAAAAGLTGATSNTFNVAVGTAAKLAFTVQPSNVGAGISISPAVQVSVEDGSGNVVTSATNSITVAIGTNPGGGTLSGTSIVAATGGIATFSSLSINNMANGYTLTASASGLTGATSNAFNVTAGAMLAFTTQPSNATAGTSITPAVQVSVEDSGGNVITTATNSITLAIASVPPDGSGTLNGTLTVAAVNGVATFSNLSIDGAGAGYSLRATSPGLTGINSSTFTINPAAVSQLVFTQQPDNVAPNASFSVAVSIEDTFGNVVTSASNTITLAISNNPSAGTLSGTLSEPASAGVATFAGLSINNAGVGYTLMASGAGSNALSNSFDVTSGFPSIGISMVGPFFAQPEGQAENATITVTNDQSGDVLTATEEIGTTPCSASTCGTFGAITGTSGSGSYTMSYTPPASLASVTTVTIAVTSNLANSFAGTFSFTINPADATLVQITGVPARIATTGNGGTALTTLNAFVYNDAAGSPGALVYLMGSGFACPTSTNPCGTVVEGTKTTGTSANGIPFTKTPLTYTPPASTSSSPYDRPMIMGTSQTTTPAFGQSNFELSYGAGLVVIPPASAFDVALATASPAPVTIQANVSGDSGLNKTVTWTLTANGASCSPQCGSLGTPAYTRNGNAVTATIPYTPPTTVPTELDQFATITATSVDNPSESDQFSFNIVDGSCGTGNNGVLNGQYAYIAKGGGASIGYQMSVGSFTADGNGNIIAGAIDRNGTLGPTSLTITGGTYTIGSDNRGCMTITSSSGGSVTWRIAVGSVSGSVATQGVMNLFVDTTGQGERQSGTFYLQTASAFNPSSIHGTYVFGGDGIDSVGDRAAEAGLVTADGVSNLSNISFDYDDGANTNGVQQLAGPFSGTFSLASNATNGRGTYQLTVSSLTLHNVVYVISGSQLITMSTDPPSPNVFLIGGFINLQSGAPFAATALDGNSYVAYQTAIDPSNGANATVITQSSFTTNGAATITKDVNDDGIEIAEKVSSNTFTIASNGRTTISGTSQPVVYLISSSEGYLVGPDNAVEFGFAQKQTGGPFTNASLPTTAFFGGSAPTVGSSYDSGAASFNTATTTISGTDDSASCGQQCGGLSPNNAIGNNGQNTIYCFTSTCSMSGLNSFTPTATGQGILGGNILAYIVSPTQVVFMQIGQTTGFGGYVPASQTSQSPAEVFTGHH